MTTRSLGDAAQARPIVASDAPAVLDLIEQNRAHLDKWLRWSARVKTRADVEAMIARHDADAAAGSGFHWGIWHRDSLAGGVICHSINRNDANAELGYWLGANFTGHGLATRASAAAVDYLIKIEQMHRLEMLCGVANTPSRAVAERLGFMNEGVRRESYWITDRYVDHVIYGLLAHEWKRVMPDQG